MPKLLALDISTHTGWATWEDSVFKDYGVIDPPKTLKELGLKYPSSFLTFCDGISESIFELVKKVQPNSIVIEETNRAKARFSQKQLEWIHCLTLQKLNTYNNLLNVHYVSTSAWRKVLDIRMSKDDKKNNKKVNDAKKNGVNKKEAGVKGKVTTKHLAIRFVKEKYNINLLVKQNNEADAICLGEAFLNNVPLTEGK